MGKADSQRAKQTVVLVATVKQAGIETLLTSPSTTITDACRKCPEHSEEFESCDTEFKRL